MKSRITVYFMAGCGGLLLSVLLARVLAETGSDLALVPAPKKVERRGGVFTLGPQAKILVDAASRATGEYLAERLRRSTGYVLPVADQAGAAAPGNLVLTTQAAPAALGAEGYQLAVTRTAVTIRAPQAAGLFYGVQTLLQLLPPEALSNQPVREVAWTIPAVEIEDQPRFAWRGMLLDSARHFFTKAEVKQVLDTMALHKLNTFQWHLTDDQGWRIEIKKYPRLTEVGGWRKGIGFRLDPKSSTAYGPDGRYGGFYTQADIREVVAYARARRITIVPEIEMPGHASAALAAYPEFSCSGGPYTTDIGAGIYPGVYCVGNESTFGFLRDVLAEVASLFPGSFIHIGGDEVVKQNWKACPKCQARMRDEKLKDEHELQSYFVRRVEQIIAQQGRRLIGWSEIREGGLPRNTAVMDWIGGAVEAAAAGHDVVMTPTTYCYFDYYQSRDRETEPLAIGGFLPLRQAYAFEPIPTNLPPQCVKHILGAQGNLWTEYIASLAHLEYMAYPRLCALAEVVWSPPQARDWDDFSRRLPAHYRRLDHLGVRCRK